MARTLTRRRSAEVAPKKYEAVDDVETTDNGDKPRGRRTLHIDQPKETKVAKPEVAAGWDAADAAKDSDFPDEFKVTEDACLIKILEDHPFAVQKQHWIERKGKKSWIHLESGCPLCEDIGDRPNAKVYFNIVDLTDPEKPVNKIWIVGSRVATQLKNLNKDKKTGPLDRDDLYYSVSKSGTSTKTVTVVTSVKERDVNEDWDMDPLSTEEIDDFNEKMFGTEVVEYHTKKQLAEIADELLGD